MRTREEEEGACVLWSWVATSSEKEACALVGSPAWCARRQGGGSLLSRPGGACAAAGAARANGWGGGWMWKMEIN